MKGKWKEKERKVKIFVKVKKKENRKRKTVILRFFSKNYIYIIPNFDLYNYVFRIQVINFFHTSVIVINFILTYVSIKN